MPRLPDLGSRRIPVLTILVVVVTAIGAVAQAVDPALLGALRRDPAALGAGEWWRTVTPLVVLDGDLWIHFAVDAVGILIVGSVVELRLGRGLWIVLFASGALIGELVGSVWDPHGAGASVGMCGLIGGLVVVQWLDRRVWLAGSSFSIGIVVLLAAEAIATVLDANGTAEWIVAVVACGVLVNVLQVARSRVRNKRAAPSLVAGVVVAGMVVLLASRDNHGAALLAGLVVTALLLLRQPAPVTDTSSATTVEP